MSHLLLSNEQALHRLDLCVEEEKTRRLAIDARSVASTATTFKISPDGTIYEDDFWQVKISGSAKYSKRNTRTGRIAVTYKKANETPGLSKATVTAHLNYGTLTAFLLVKTERNGSSTSRIELEVTEYSNILYDQFGIMSYEYGSASLTDHVTDYSDGNLRRYWFSDAEVEYELEDNSESEAMINPDTNDLVVIAESNSYYVHIGFEATWAVCVEFDRSVSARMRVPHVTLYIDITSETGPKDISKIIKELDEYLIKHEVVTTFDYYAIDPEDMS